MAPASSSINRRHPNSLLRAIQQCERNSAIARARAARRTSAIEAGLATAPSDEMRENCTCWFRGQQFRIR